MPCSPEPFGITSGLMGEASIPSLPVITISEFRRLNLLTDTHWRYIETYNLLPVQYTLHHSNETFTHSKCALPEFVRDKPVNLPYKPLEVTKETLPFMPAAYLSKTYRIDPYKIIQAILDKKIPAFKIEGFGLVVPYSEEYPSYLKTCHVEDYTSLGRNIVADAVYNCPSCNYQLPITISEDEYNRQYHIAELKARFEKAAAIATAEQLQLLVHAHQALDFHDLTLCLAPDITGIYAAARIKQLKETH